MKRYNKFKVYYNNDCMMWGVMQLVEGYSYTSESKKWVQILPPKGKGGRKGKSAFTYYEAVAKRWLKELQK